MRFLVTMNMASKSNNLVHQVICDYPVQSIEEFLEELTNEDFILCEHYYRESPNKVTLWTLKGKMILNTSLIGKVMEFVD